MASPEVLDFAKLLAPISAEKPTGVDPRSDISPTSLHYKIKGDRSAARGAERQAVTGDDTAGPPDWKPVRQLGIKVLTEQAKDLEITAYLIEALLRLEGFTGLRDGFRLARELVEKYWDGLYPLPDELGLATRVAPLAALNGEDTEGTLIAPIARVPLTDGSSAGRLSYADYQEALSFNKITDPKLREKKLAQGALSMETFQKAVAETPPKFFTTLMEDLQQCLGEFARLYEALDKKCGASAPPSTHIRTALVTIIDVIKDVARHKLQTAPAKQEQPAASEGAGKDPSRDGAAATGNGALTREEAFRELLKLAEFFRRTEPQSVVSYALEQVVRWGQLSLPELLIELIPDEAPRRNVFKQVGIRPPEPPPKEEKKK